MQSLDKFGVDLEVGECGDGGLRNSAAVSGSRRPCSSEAMEVGNTEVSGVPPEKMISSVSECSVEVDMEGEPRTLWGIFIKLSCSCKDDFAAANKVTNSVLRPGSRLRETVEYRDGFVEYFDYFNCDEGSLLDLRRMVKQLRFCDKKVQFWVKVKGITRRKKTEVRKVSTDAEILLLNLEVPTNKELEIYVEHLYDDQWDYEVEISRSLGDDALFSDVQEEGSEQQSEREVEGPETVFEEVEVEVNGPTSKGVENEVEVDVNEVDCVHSEEIFRSLADSDSERDFNDSEIVFQERNLKREGFKFVLGMIFQSASEFKWAVKYHEALRRKDVKFVKNEGRRVRACCRHNDICKWTIFGSRSNPRCPFQIKTYNPEHTCGDQDENKTVNSGHNKTTCKAKNPQVSEQVGLENQNVESEAEVEVEGHNDVEGQFEDIPVETQVPAFVLDEMGSQEAVGSQSSQPLHNHAPQVSTFISSQTTTSTADEELLRIGLRSRTLAAIQRLGRPGKLYLIRKKQ
nr:Zinc knuckle family protein [Ipomoea batatas]